MPGSHPLNVLKDQVAIPPHSGIIISVGTEKSADIEGVIEGDQHLFVKRDICVVRGIAELRGGKV